MPKSTVSKKDKSADRKRKDMPSVSKSNKKKSGIIAILASDLHISLNPPIARSVEEDWLEVQARYLREVADYCDVYNAPLVIAGDIFHKWNEPPEVINFLMKELPPKVFAVAGQHDLPNHRLDDIKRSSYHTLMLSDSIKHLDEPQILNEEFNWWVQGCSWGEDLDESVADDKEKSLAVIHSYIWMNENKYPGAPKDKNVNKWVEHLQGYRAAVFGDNHKGFVCMAEEPYDPWILNCGTFIRRTIEDINYRPRIGALYESGMIEQIYLDTEKDKFIDTGEALAAIESAMSATEFIRELSGLGKSVVDFFQAVDQFCKKNNIDKRVQQIIREVLET